MHAYNDTNDKHMGFCNGRRSEVPAAVSKDKYCIIMLEGPPHEKMLEVDWPRHSSRSFHCKSCFTLDARRETQKGPPQDHVATDSGEGNKGDGEDLGRHQAHGKGSADVEAACCCNTCHLGIKAISE